MTGRAAKIASGERVAHDDRLVFGHGFRCRCVVGWPVIRLRKEEPIETVGRQRQQVGQLADRRKLRVSIKLDRHASLELRQVELDSLRRARQIGDAEDGGVFVFAQISEDLAIFRIQQTVTAAAEDLVLAADARSCGASTSATNADPRLAIQR